MAIERLQNLLTIFYDAAFRAETGGKKTRKQVFRRPIPANRPSMTPIHRAWCLKLQSSEFAKQTSGWPHHRRALRLLLATHPDIECVLM